MITFWRFCNKILKQLFYNDIINQIFDQVLISFLKNAFNQKAPIPTFNIIYF